MATTKSLCLICEIANFANAYLEKVTKFQGYGVFRFSNLLVWRWNPPLVRIGLIVKKLLTKHCSSVHIILPDFSDFSPSNWSEIKALSGEPLGQFSLLCFRKWDLYPKIVSKNPGLYQGILHEKILETRL